MALDNPEIGKVLAELAFENEAEKVILQPTPDRGWEFNKNGKLIQRDTHIINIKSDCRHIHCIPKHFGTDTYWHCSLFDKNQINLKEWTEDFPR